MKQQKQTVVLVLLLAAAVGVWLYNRRQNPVTPGSALIASSYSPMNVDNLQLRTAKRDASRASEYKGTGRNPFDATPPPPPAAKVPQRGDPGYIEPPPPPPPKAELPPNMKYYGYGTVPNGSARRAYLTDGDDVYIVAEGDTLLGRFRILKIGNAMLEFEDVSSHVQGQKSMEDVGPSS
jgi:hypothetical protein